MLWFIQYILRVIKIDKNMGQIATLTQLHDLQNSTCIYAVVVCAIAIFVAYLVSNMIAWQGGNDRSYIKRRVWWIIIGIVVGLGFWIYNDVVNVPRITNMGFRHMYSQTNLFCLFLVLIGYFLISLLLMLFLFRKAKFGSILGKQRNK